MGTLVDLTGMSRHVGTVRPPRPPTLPLVPCNPEPSPAWRLERLGEDRFRLTISAARVAGDDIEVFIEGAFLHIENTADTAEGRTLDCTFLLLEPLAIVRVEMGDGELAVELERDHAMPCAAVLPPVRREGVAALALAA